MTETAPSPDEIAAERPPLMSRVALGTYPLGGGYGAPGVPQQWPYSRYQGKGNRMIWVDFGEGVDARKVATDTHVLESLSGSTRWNTRVTYAVRDVGECLLVCTKADIGS